MKGPELSHPPRQTDQRQHARQLARIEVEWSSHQPTQLQDKTTQTRQIKAKNISLGGAWLTWPENQPGIGEIANLHAKVGKLNLYMVAKVVRKNSLGIGVSFIDMGFETYDMLRKIMQRLSEKSAQ